MYTDERLDFPRPQTSRQNPHLVYLQRFSVEQSESGQWLTENIHSTGINTQTLAGCGFTLWFFNLSESGQFEVVGGGASVRLPAA